MSVRDRVNFIPRSDFGSAGMAAGYAAANAGGLEEACFMIRIINDSDTDINISFDGTTDHEYLRTQEVLQIGFQANSQPSNFRSLLARGTVIYFRGTAGAGTIYISGYYSSPNS